MSVLLAFLGTKAGRYTVAILVIVIATVAVIAHYRARAIQLGEDKQKAAELEQQKTSLLKDNEAAKEKLEHAEQDAVAAGEQTKQAMDLASRAQGVIDGLSNQVGQLQSLRAQQDAAIARIPDSDLTLDIQRKLGVRRPGDTTPGFTALELRTIDTAVTDGANVSQQNIALKQQITELSAKAGDLGIAIDGMQKQVTAISAERDVAIDRWNATMKAYSEAYDEFPRTRSLGEKVCHVVTFGLGCKQKLFKLPSPAELAKAN